MQGNIKTRSLGMANSKDNSKFALRSCPSRGDGNNQVGVFEYAGTTYYQNICNDFPAPTSGELDFTSNSVNSDLKQSNRRVENTLKHSNLKVENDFKPLNNRVKDGLKQSNKRVEDNLKQSNRRASSARPYPLGRDKGDRSPWPSVASDHYPTGASYGSSSSYSVLKNRRSPSLGQRWMDKTGSSHPGQNLSRNRGNRGLSSSAQNWPKRSGSSPPNLTYINRDYGSFGRTSLEGAASGLGTNQWRSRAPTTPSWPRESFADKASSGNLYSVRSHTNLKKDATPIWNDSFGIDSWSSHLRVHDPVLKNLGFQSSSQNWSGITAADGRSVSKTTRSFRDSSPTTSTENAIKSSYAKAHLSRPESRFQKDVKSGWNTSTTVYSKRLDNRGWPDTSFKQSEWPIKERSFENPTYLGGENNLLVNSVSCPKHYTKSGQAYIPVSSGIWHSRRSYSELTEASRIKRNSSEKTNVSFSGDGHREGAGSRVKLTGEGSRAKSSAEETGSKLANGGTGSKLVNGGTGSKLANGGTGSKLANGGTGSKLTNGGTGGKSSIGGKLANGGTGGKSSSGGPHSKSLVGGSGGNSSVKGTGSMSLVGEIRRTGGNSLNEGPGSKSGINEGPGSKSGINEGPGSKSGNEDTGGYRHNFKSRVITNSFINIETIRKAEEGFKETTDDQMRDASSDDDYLKRIENLKVYELKGQEFNLSFTKVLIDVFEPIMSQWKQFVSANEEKEGGTEHDDEKLVNETEGPANRDITKFESDLNKDNSLFGESTFSGSQNSHLGESCIAPNTDDNEVNSDKVGDEDTNHVIDDSSEKCDLFDKCYSPATGLRLIQVSSSIKNYIFTLGDRGDICRFLLPLVTEIVIIDKIICDWKKMCVLNIGVIVEDGQPQFYEAIKNANCYFSHKGFQFNPRINSSDIFHHLANTKITPKVDKNGMYQITIKFNLTQGTKEEMDKNEKDLSKELERTVKYQGVEKISVGAGERILQLGHNKDMLKLSEILKNVFDVTQTKHVWANKAFEEKTKELSPPLLAHQKQDNIITLSMSDLDDDSFCEGDKDIESSSDSTQRGSMSRGALEELLDDNAEKGSSIDLQWWMEEFISNLIDIIILYAEKESDVDELNVDSSITRASKPSPDSEKSNHNETGESKHEVDELGEGLLIFQGIKEAEIDSVENDVNWFGKVIATSRYERHDKSWDVHVSFETSREIEAAYLGLREKYTLLPKFSEARLSSKIVEGTRGNCGKVENLEETIENTEEIVLDEHDPIFRLVDKKLT